MKNRFWEYYLIRYLAGTIFGVAIIAYLLVNYSDKIGDRFYNNKNHTNIRDVVISYLFDTTYYFNAPFPEKFRLDNNEVILISSEKDNMSNNDSRTIRKNEVNVLSMIILSVVGFLYMYISSALVLFFHTFRFVLLYLIKGGRKSSLYEFYLILSRTRARGKEEVRIQGTNKGEGGYWINEYVESYRHLREHGNAFGILLSELLFAIFLIKNGI